jgi:hypothetical protein
LLLAFTLEEIMPEIHDNWRKTCECSGAPTALESVRVDEDYPRYKLVQIAQVVPVCKTCLAPCEEVVFFSAVNDPFLGRR